MGDGRISVEVVTGRRYRAPGLAKWLISIAPGRARGRVTIAVVPDARVWKLNKRYRRKDAPTDVLSFPASADRLRRGRPSESGDLGDIVIAAGVARRQAQLAGHTLQTELRILALHGLLHLLGYDHDNDDGRMARLETRLRKQGGLREGLIERAMPISR